jgi:dynein heavy chain
MYINICRGLFNNHKKIFAFLIASSIERDMGNVNKMEWDILLKGVGFNDISKV